MRGASPSRHEYPEKVETGGDAGPIPRCRGRERTDAEIARRPGVTRASLSHEIAGYDSYLRKTLENPSRSPTLDSVEKIAAALGMEPMDLLVDDRRIAAGESLLRALRDLPEEVKAELLRR